MAGDLNRVSLIGRLGKDPEVRTFANGGAVCNFSVATGESWTDKNTGERKEKTEWHNISVNSPGLVNLASQFLKKGSRCFIEGKLQTRKWIDQSGNDKYITEIVISGFGGQLIFLDPKGSSGGAGAFGGGYGGGRSGGGGTTSGQSQFGGRGGGSPFDSDLDDDVPF